MIAAALDDSDRTGLERVAERLCRPTAMIAAVALPQHWRQTDIRAVCRRPREFDGGPTLGGRIRGALGHALAAVAAAPPASAARRRALWGWPSAFAALFAAEWGSGRTPPYAIAAEEMKNSIHIRIALFGFAAMWAPEVKTALVQAMSAGIAIAPEAPVRTPLTVESLEVQTPTLSPVLPTRDALLLLHGLLQIRSDQSLTYSAQAFVDSLCNRMVALARWQDLALTIDDTSAMATNLTLSFEPPRPYGWTRRSSAQPGREIPMIGTRGRLTLSGQLEPLMPFLRIGEVAQIGGRTTTGYGYYELISLP